MKFIDEATYGGPSPNPIVGLGRALLHGTRCSGKALVISFAALGCIGDVVRRRAEIGRQLWVVGVKSFGVTEIVALFTGMILSLQAGLALRDYGQEVNVGVIVSQTMCREMGPFMTALILAASVGSAMAAELGTMTVSEEIDALEVMAVSPVSYLVMPRLMAMLIMMPALTIYTDLIGTIGGGVVANTQLDVAWSAYFRNVMDHLEMKEIMVGLLKSVIFGFVVSTVSCYEGLTTTNGAVGVGIATRRSVVFSFLLVLIIGYFVTRLFY
jgi:phospholipid/cholesterol/gamma-HCH transport system permease protein